MPALALGTRPVEVPARAREDGEDSGPWGQGKSAFPARTLEPGTQASTAPAHPSSVCCCRAGGRRWTCLRAVCQAHAAKATLARARGPLFWGPCLPVHASAARPMLLRYGTRLV